MNSFNHKLKNLDIALKDLLEYLETCPIDRMEAKAEQALEIIYNFTDTLAEVEEIRYSGNADTLPKTCGKSTRADYEDFDYVDEEVDIYNDEVTEKYLS